MRGEPSQPDTRKEAFYSNLGVLASRGEFRYANIKSEQSWNAMFANSLFDRVDTGTPSVSPTAGQRLSLVYSCLNVLGETVGSLPFAVKKYGDNGAEAAYSHAVYKLIHDRPNPYTTAFDFWSTVEKLKHIYGNAYALIDRDVYGDPVALYLVHSDEIVVQQTLEGEVYYKWADRTIRATDILHFKNYSTDGHCGVSTITANRLSVGLGLKLKGYNSSLIGNRTHGYLTSETKPKDLEQKSQMRKQWNQPEGDSTTQANKAEIVQTGAFGAVPLLYGGLKFVSLTLPADQAAYIGSVELNDRDILGMFRMPPTMVSIYKDAPYNSSEQQDIAFVKYTLASLRQYEQECDYKLFPTGNRTYFTKFSLNGILRGDMKTRMQFYSSGIQNGWMTPNQACEFEDLPTYGKEGDRHFMQGALVPSDLIEKFVLSKSTQKTNQPDNQKSDEERTSEIKAELREHFKSRLNGKYKEVADLLE